MRVSAIVAPLRDRRWFLTISLPDRSPMLSTILISSATSKALSFSSCRLAKSRRRACTSMSTVTEPGSGSNVGDMIRRADGFALRTWKWSCSSEIRRSSEMHPSALNGDEEGCRMYTEASLIACDDRGCLLSIIRR